jgi:mannose-6-phosphate isomerase
MSGRPRVWRLTNTIRPYAWGSITAIPELLGQPPTGEPGAELWIGAHPREPSRLADDPARPGLDELIAAAPGELMGERMVAEYGPRLPFLLKLLAADKCLSLQVHPDAAQARAGFDSEQRRGVPVNAPERDYADPHHKPELLCALTDFEALCGFRPAAATAELLATLIGHGAEALGPYRELLAGPGGLRAVFTALLTLAPGQRGGLVEAVAAACRRELAQAGPWSGPARASLLAAEDFPGDIGAVVTLLLNYLRLRPGQAIFLGAGNVHAYLRGFGVEILANSDNVLRCGLTSKHIDVPELLRVADFSCLPEPRWQPARPAAGQQVFQVPEPDFRLSVLDLAAGEVTLGGDRPHLVLSSESPVTLSCGTGADKTEVKTLERWNAAFVAPGPQLCTLSGSGTAFVASTNLPPDGPPEP